MTVEFTQGDVVSYIHHISPDELNIRITPRQFEAFTRAVIESGHAECLSNGEIVVPNVLLKVRCDYPPLLERLQGR